MNSFTICLRLNRLFFIPFVLTFSTTVPNVCPNCRFVRGLLSDSDFFSSTEVLSGTLRRLYHGEVTVFMKSFISGNQLTTRGKSIAQRYCCVKHPDCLCLVMVSRGSLSPLLYYEIPNKYRYQCPVAATRIYKALL
jgi:hypothetical protein